MITIAAILITCYLTKVYYTRSAIFKTSKFDDKDLIHAKCSKCSAVTRTNKDNLRIPFYCSMCK
jgi:predicted Zn-ribbon and HTH transcriptional regulator